MTRGLLVVIALTGPILASALFDLTRLVVEGTHVPEDSEYVEIARLVDADGFDARTDVVAILPAWSLRPLVALRPRPTVSGDALETRPLERHRRLYLVVERDGEEARDRVLARGRATAVGATAAVELWRVELDGPRVRYDLRASLPDAQVRIAAGDGRELSSCASRVRGGFSCEGRKSWQRVTREHALVSENGDDVIWAHAPPANERLEIRYPGVTLGREIVIRAGHTRTGADRATAPVKLEVIHGDVRLFAVDRAPAFDFATSRIDTASRRGAQGDLVIRISTRDNGSQHFAYDGYVVDDGVVGP